MLEFKVGEVVGYNIPFGSIAGEQMGELYQVGMVDDVISEGTSTTLRIRKSITDKSNSALLIDSKLVCRKYIEATP
jgi:hypothetical protein